MTRIPVIATQKWRIWSKIAILRENFQNSFIKVQYIRQRLTIFPNFMPIYPVTKKWEFILYPLQKKLPPFSTPFCAPLAQGVKILTREIWVRPTYVCVILSGSVMVCRSYSRKADFEQIHTLSRTHETETCRVYRTDIGVARSSCL